MSTSVPALLRSTTETEYLAPENTPASAADAWAVRSRSGWAGAGTYRLEHAPRRRLGTNPAEPRLVGETFVGGAVIGDTAVGGVDRGTGPAAPADETLPDEPSPSFEHPRTDNSTTIVTTENIAISTVRRRRTYVSSRVDIILTPGGFARRRGRHDRRHASRCRAGYVRPRRGGRICFAIAHLPDCSHRRPHCNPPERS